MNNFAVIGAGAWGIALTLQIVRAGHHVSLVAREGSALATIRTRRESARLPGFRLPDQVDVRDDIPQHAKVLLWVVPTQQLRSSLENLRPRGHAIVVCAKGVEAQKRLLPLEIVADTCPTSRLAVLTGPNFAREVAMGLPAAAVVASTDAELREEVRDLLGTHGFRLYGSDDPTGAQVGGAAKNVIAIAAGAVMGAGLGENARAALVTRGLNELRRITVSLGGRAETVMGLSGLGDLLLTCTGGSSRNFSLGHALGRGRTLTDILTNTHGVAEGVATAAALVARAGNIELPICRAVADLLAGTRTLDQAISELLSRPQRDE